MKKQTKDILKQDKLSEIHSREEKEMFVLFHQPENEFEIKSILLSELNNFELQRNISPDYKTIFNKTWDRINDRSVHPEKKGIKTIYPLLRIAAVLVVGLLIGLAIDTNLKPKEADYYQSHAPEGSTSDLTLPDGTVIFLNAGTEVRYSVEGKKGVREVFLQGEAWFDVKKNPEKPFVVHTPFYDVNVTGTKFNIKAYESDGEVITTLEEGQVRIAEAPGFKLAEEIILQPGEQLIFSNESKKMSIKKVNTKLYTSWKENKLIFVNHRLEDLVTLLERKYGVDIEVKNQELLDLHFDGTFKDESLIDILDILQKALSVKYEIIEQHVIITNSANN